jgi:HD-GYP domain-containing protein (c-di-GMP phosphodiesterase class II)
MSPLTLHHPVYSLENQQLFSAHTIIYEETLDALISSSKKTFHQNYSLLKYGTVKEDLYKLLSSTPYNLIFADQKQITNIFNIMGSVNYVLPVLQSLDYFKIHDYYTYRHILIVFALSTLLTEDLVSDYHERIKGTMAGPFHDIGKICVPLHVLTKSDPLNQTELSVLQHHSAAGYILLCYYLRETQNISAIVARDHHERRDGSGYPQGILQNNLITDIITVSDIYDALISPRPYRLIAYNNRTALEEITAMAESNKIDWAVVKALVSHNRKENPHYSDCTVSTEKRGTPPPDNVYGVIVDKEE